MIASILFLSYLNIINEFLYNKQSILEIQFYVNSSNDVLLIPLQDVIYSEAGETSLIFFRLINLTNKDISILTTYTIFPSLISAYVNKLQCFCFEMIHLNKNEQIDLPVIFFLSKSINMDFPFIKKIILFYDVHIY